MTLKDPGIGNCGWADSQRGRAEEAEPARLGRGGAAQRAPDCGPQNRPGPPRTV